MAGPTKRRLYSPDAVVDVRGARMAADAPSVGDWTPDNRNAGEAGPDEVILDAREWSHVRVLADFRGPTGLPVAGGSVDVVPLIATRDPVATMGRRWKELEAISTLPGDEPSDPIQIDGHLAAFRITAYVAGGATDVVLRVTGGQPQPKDAV